MPVPCTTAWVESPLQLLGALEHAALTADERDQPLAIIPRAGDPQLGRTADVAHAREMPRATAIGIERRLLPWPRFRAGGDWLVGDPFSGLVQARLARAVPERLVIVDDGAITRRLARLLDAGEPLLRPAGREGESLSGLRTTLGATTTRTLLALAAEGRLEVTTYLDPADPASGLLGGLGAVVRHHRFAWTRDQGLEARAVPPDHLIVLGTAGVADGRVDPAEQRRFVAELARAGRVAYLPHRREPGWFLRAVARERNVVVIPAHVPIELSLGGASRALDIVSRPSSALETLRLVLDGTRSRILLADPLSAAG
ncbi:hypothetical protein GCM10009792_10070 [Microcella alkalica]|uniref:Uncharacterized protein n=1 Tax=Microcella alkalica TaxID=355930 RepID=A0A839E8N8_9MICO|nr:hypothetical protein [Microcella alkalica]MBA8848911.1 hypothetical protein [Microcella alkalica]